MHIAAGTVPALERGLDVLEVLSGVSDGLGISDLAARLELNKNAVFRITHTLTARGYLERDPESKRFRLSTKLLTLGHPRIGDVSLVEAALEPMRDLRDLTRETVQLGIRIGEEGVIIEQVSGLHPLRIAVDIGLKFPMHSNAPGKVLLAYQSAREIDDCLARIPLTQFTSKTITDPEELRQECVHVKRVGYATDFAEADEGIHCVAAPIRGRGAEIAAAVWVSAPARRLRKSAFAATGARVIECAETIARRLYR